MIVNIRTSVIGRIRRPPSDRRPQVAGTEARTATERPVYFSETGGFTPTAVVDRSSLPTGARIAGPAIIEQPDSTCVVHPGYVASMGMLGELIVEAALNPATGSENDHRNAGMS